MSVGFSTIKPLDPSTISRAPKYSTTTPAASSPIDTNQTTTKKKSHWFRNTVIGLAVIATAVALGQRFLPTIFDKAATLATDAKWYDKALHYAKKGVAIAGEFINKYVDMGIDLAKAGYNKIKGMIGGSATPPATP